MTSFGASKVLREPGYMPTFKIQGQVYHSLGALQPTPGQEPKFVQIYFMQDRQQQAQHRSNLFQGLKEGLIFSLQEMLHANNNLIRSFKYALQKQVPPEHKIIIRADKTPSGEHQRRFNAPTTNDVALIMRLIKITALGRF
ncbi:Uncharacterised protein r2_g524 [Pycnogonum litorale]